MKLADTLLLACSAVFLLIGIHQSMMHGFQSSYFLFMMSTGFFLWYTLRRKKADSDENSGNHQRKNPPQENKRK